MKYLFIICRYIMDRYVLKRKAPSQDVPDDMNWKEEIQYDPGKRKLIESYHPNLRIKSTFYLAGY